MIKKILILPLILLSMTVFSQQNGDAKYSFGVRGYNYLELPELLNQTKDHRFISSNFSSYIVKFNDNLFSYRLSGSYLHKSDQFSNNCENCQFAAGKVKDYSFKAGFEKNFTYGPVQPYLGFDLGYRSNEFNGNLTDTNPVNFNISTRKRGFTISPLVGIKQNPIKDISIFAESNVEFFYAWGKTQSDPEVYTQNRFQKGELLLNPVSVGIQFHLGHKN
ncbi:hypothetical protein SAMN06265348_103353 [Pedobacter westerhofensis]|uniref:Outer membrane protein beta-barrel domain-containing protein n=1 Tax=Pedobacter westerhofensis TaxID=425512 RepID=A0A521C9P6_9SPHI|nr:hypothetical protein [Pedobacter westerhofensis]SMO56104.1 hypothetical protein SAMN06265348_103353 [Pedobacter westerhofensis]